MSVSDVDLKANWTKMVSPFLWMMSVCFIDPDIAAKVKVNEIDRTQGRSEIKNIVTSGEEVYGIDDTSKNVEARTQTYDIRIL